LEISRSVRDALRQCSPIFFDPTLPRKTSRDEAVSVIPVEWSQRRKRYIAGDAEAKRRVVALI
jgi:hypothetical protein